MHSSLLITTFSASAALASINLRAATFEKLAGLQKRQIPTCFGTAPSTESNPCEYVCGEGSRQCVTAGHCFNPTKGETCCEDGTYCPAGSYCSNEGCCDESLTLEECGATYTIATLPGEYFSTSMAPAPTEYESSTTSWSSSEVVEPTLSSYSPPSYSTSSSYSPPSYATSSSSSIWSSSSIEVTILPTGSSYPTTPTTSSADSNGTLPSYTPAQQTTNSGFKLEVVGWALGGWSFLGLGFFL